MKPSMVASAPPAPPHGAHVTLVPTDHDLHPSSTAFGSPLGTQPASPGLSMTNRNWVVAAGTPFQPLNLLKSRGGRGPFRLFLARLSVEAHSYQAAHVCGIVPDSLLPLHQARG